METSCIHGTFLLKSCTLTPSCLSLKIIVPCLPMGAERGREGEREKERERERDRERVLLLVVSSSIFPHLFCNRDPLGAGERRHEYARFHFEFPPSSVNAALDVVKYTYMCRTWCVMETVVHFVDLLANYMSKFSTTV